MKHNSLILLSSLLSGSEIELELVPGNKYQVSIIDTEEGEKVLCFAMYKSDTTLPELPPEKVYMKCDLTVNSLIKLAEKFTEGELFLMSSEVVLRSMNHLKSSRRKRVGNDSIPG